MYYGCRLPFPYQRSLYLVVFRVDYGDNINVGNVVGDNGNSDSNNRCSWNWRTNCTRVKVVPNTGVARG